MKTAVLIFILAFSLFSCSVRPVPYYTLNDLVKLKKGESPEEINKSFNTKYIMSYKTDDTNIKVFSVNIACAWRVESQQYVEYNPNSISSDADGMVGGRETVNTAIISPFFMVYENNRLSHWGFRYEFKNDKNFNNAVNNIILGLKQDN